MRFTFGRCALVLAVACVLAGSFAASARPAPTNFHFARTFETFPATLTPRFTFITLFAMETSIPHVGRAVVEGSFVSQCPAPLTCPPAGGSTLRLEIEAKRGTLVLSGDSSNLSTTTNAGSWSVVGATGRFAGYVGTGTWTWTAPSLSTATVSIAGRIRNAG